MRGQTTGRPRQGTGKNTDEKSGHFWTVCRAIVVTWKAKREQNPSIFRAGRKEIPACPMLSIQVPRRICGGFPPFTLSGTTCKPYRRGARRPGLRNARAPRALWWTIDGHTPLFRYYLAIKSLRGKERPEFLSMKRGKFGPVTLRIFKTPGKYPPLGG